MRKASGAVKKDFTVKNQKWALFIDHFPVHLVQIRVNADAEPNVSEIANRDRVDSSHMIHIG